MTTLALVDSPEAAAAARALHPDAVVATDNPFLALGEEGIVNGDALIPQDEALRAGTLALDLTAEIDRAVQERAATFGLDPDGTYLTGTLSRLLSCLFHRGLILARLIERHAPREIGLFALDAPRWEPASPLLLPRFAHPARSLAEHGFFDGATFTFQPVTTALPGKVNDTRSDSALRRAALLPPGSIVVEVLRRLRLLPRGRGGRIVVAEENETIREAVPWLLAKGCRVEFRGALTRDLPKAPRGFAEPAPVDPDLLALVAPILERALGNAGFFTPGQRQAIAALVAQHLRPTIDLLPVQRDAIAARLAAWFGTQGGILLTNGLYGPAGATAFPVARQAGIRVFEFEHGVTASIAALTQKKFALHPPPAPDRHFVSSDDARLGLDPGGGHAGDFRVVGLPDQTRRLHLRPLQRHLARRGLGLRDRRPVVFYVCTVPMYGNHRPGLGTPTETATVTLNLTLTREVFQRIGKRVVFKPYPTQRFPFERRYEQLLPDAGDILFCGDEDFRYIRAAADVIVTSTPTSTLGWCVGLDVPLVWLDSALIHPLANEALRREFAAAFPTVDIDEPGWPERLRALLDQPMAALRADWEHRRPARAALYARAITGPDGSVGRRVADLIAAEAG